MLVSGAEALLTMLADAGVRHLFGNPGTTELPLTDALAAGSPIQYILGLHEIPVVAMADGYAMAGKRLGVCNVHISCGLGNAMGMLYNAYREGTPLLVTAGQQDNRLAFEEPILGGDMVSVARPWTKWAVEVPRIQDLPSAVRRAIQVAMTPPTGPVFMSLPMDVQMERAELDLSPAAPLSRAVRPPLDALRRAAELLLAAKRPAILCGSRVLEADAVGELTSVAERIGAPVIIESGTTHGRLGFSPNHPHYAGGLPLWSPEIRERLKDYDVLLVCGMDLLRQYVYHEPARAIPEHIRLIHLDEDPRQLGKNYPLAVGLQGDTKSGLAELEQILVKQISREQAAAVERRRAGLAAEHAAALKACRQAAEQQRTARPMTPLTLMSSLARVLPENVAIVEEAVTTTNTVLERLGAIRRPDSYFGHRGWALGWGLGCALGVRLAWPERPTLAILGDGAAMFGIQALWTAAHYKIPVTVVICNNAQYQILKVGARGMGLPQAQAGKFLGLDITSPEIDFVGLSRSLGVDAVRITEPDALSDAVGQSLADDKPRLIEVAIDRQSPERLEYG
ncbi:MAG: thiamine pyrophosphate-binding protein [Planctomycetia bacterium]|nr:thiamine pyrophosphate-binding protein [Planctomycetia bacterium]